MRIGVALPNYGPLASPDVLARLAALAEARGADGIWVSDHLVAPVGSQSVYPYDRRPDPQPGQLGVIEEFYEALVTLAFLAGQTRRVRLGVSAYVLPCRNPVVTAKQVATLDALSGGRVVLGDRRRLAARGVRGARRALRGPRAAHRRLPRRLRALWAGGDGVARRTVLPASSRAHRTAPRAATPSADLDRRQLGRGARTAPRGMATRGTGSTWRPTSWRRPSSGFAQPARRRVASQARSA